MKRILVVDDEENIRELYRDELVEEGYEVELAEDGLEALSKFDSFRPDLVTLDVKMPGLDGL
ncbi:MAG TPA: response regulator, partial [Candidatus Deferrimicrobiaceae bacterium]|nr:response regulator [Candidatus Deferrimicrobiaceae bacterium]